MADHEQTADDAESGPESRGKVARVMAEYELTEIGDELVESWTAEPEERKSLRELAEEFNKALLARALQKATGKTLDGEAANFYRLLTSEDVTSGTRIEAKNRLEEYGIDVDQIRDSFVSRQAIHTYLTKERDASFTTVEQSDDERTESRLKTVQRLKNRLGAVAEQTLSELTASGLVSVGNAQVIVLVRIQCEDCGVQYSFTELVRSRECRCPSD